MPRDALIDELFRDAEATVVLDHDASACGFAILRRFGRGHAIGPVVAPDAEGAKALIAHLSGLNAGRFTRIDIDFDSGLAEWLETLGLLRVDAPTTMLRGAPLATRQDGPRLYAHRHAGARLMRPVFVYKADPQRGRAVGRDLRAARRRRSTSASGPTSAMRPTCAFSPPGSRRRDLATRFPNLQLLLSTGAGVDQFDFSVLPPDLPVVRMVEPGIVHGMVEYVTHAVLDLHRDMPAYRRAQQQRQWQADSGASGVRAPRRRARSGLARAGGAATDSSRSASTARAGAARAMTWPACVAMPAPTSSTAFSRAARSSSACCR